MAKYPYNLTNSEAKIELGDAVAAKLKLTKDGSKVLWPQPTDSPLDPQNWSDRRKNSLLVIMTLAAIVPDFDSGIGALIFAQPSILRCSFPLMCVVTRVRRYCLHLRPRDSVQHHYGRDQQPHLKVWTLLRSVHLC